ncbi:hypothetical protein TRVA0_073S00276 [Trichomonascus vanleenenianus]|uniref:uncharacterized protein n=1 Tax=Trichomonascus vanleenenianus TaxID=2268995 RepID=UPI003ECAF888
MDSHAMVEEIDLRNLEYTDGGACDQLICPICRLVFEEPYSTTCGHTFCKSCLYSALDATPEGQVFRCPIDRHPLGGASDMGPAAFLITSLVNELEVNCLFSHRGCTFQGKKWTIESHIKEDCGFVKVLCGGLNDDGDMCDRTVQRRFVKASKGKEQGEEPGVDEEEEEVLCVHREVECPKGCGDRIVAYEVEEHLDKSCRNISLECSACSHEIAKPDFSEHEQVCPEMVVECSALKYGCSWSGKRSELFRDHSLSCPFVQLMPLLQRQDTRLEGLEAENKILRFHIERLTMLSNRTSGSPSSPDHTNASVVRSGESAGGSSFSEADLLHMFMECERLRSDVDRLTTNLSDFEAKQSMFMMRENCRTADELANLRSGFNGLRHQLHFLLTERRSMASYRHMVSSDASTNSSNTSGGTRNISELFRQDVKL